jgi:beta-galactosidase
LRSDVASLAPSRGSLAYVLVEVVDAQGRLLPDAIVPVTFDIAGTAELAGVANGNARNVHSFKQPRIYTFHGKALAILRSAGVQNRPSRFSAHSPGLGSDMIAI